MQSRARGQLMLRNGLTWLWLNMALVYATGSRGASGVGMVAGAAHDVSGSSSSQSLVSGDAFTEAPTMGEELPLMSSAPNFPGTGVQACPCIQNVTAWFEANEPSALQWPSPRQCDQWSDRVGTCLGADYGSATCEQWDLENSEGRVLPLACQGDVGGVVPPWCSLGWCYVDARQCATKNSHLPTFPFRGRVVPQSSLLRYSYETCGNRDLYSSNPDPFSNLHGVSLRVTAPDVSSPTPHFWRENADGTINATGGVWRGPAWDMIVQIASGNNMTLRPQHLSAESTTNIDMGGSTWWGCLHELTINATDLCVGDFWVYPERRAFLAPYATYTVPFAAADFVAVAMAENLESSLWDKALTPLQSFTNGLWLTTVGIMIINWLGYTWAERRAAQLRQHKAQSRLAANIRIVSKTATSRSGAGAVLAKTGASQVVKKGGKIARQAVTTILDDDSRGGSVAADTLVDDNDDSEGPDPAAAHLADAFMVTMLAPMATNHAPRSHGGRVIQMGCCIFALLSLTLWSAAVTTQLVMAATRTSQGITSLYDATQNNLRICAYDSLGRQLSLGLALPAQGQRWDPAIVRNLMVPISRISSATDTLNAMNASRDGTCQMGIIELSQLQVAIAVSGEDHCGKGAVGTSVTTPQEVAVPLRKELEVPFSYAINTYNMRNRYMASLHQASQNRWSTACAPFLSDRSSASSATNELSVIDVDSMLLAIVISLSCVAIGILLTEVVSTEELSQRVQRAETRGRGLLPDESRQLQTAIEKMGAMSSGRSTFFGDYGRTKAVIIIQRQWRKYRVRVVGDGGVRTRIDVENI